MRTLWPALIGSAVTLLSASVNAQVKNEIQLDIPSQVLVDALNQWAQATGYQLVAPANMIRYLPSPRLQGTYTARSALDELLAQTPLTYQFVDERTVAIVELKRARAPAVVERQEPSVQRLAAQTNTEWAQGARAAADPAKERGNPIEEVIVTAQKREERAFDVPMSIVALQGAQLEARGIDNLTDIATSVPGVATASLGGASASQPNIRGVGNEWGASSLVGIYLDESSVTGSNANQIDLRTHDLERVEVLRGPQGTLYGESSMGGTLRFITKEPELNSFGVKGEASFSRVERGSWGQALKGVLNIPVVEEKLGVRLAAAYEDVGGWIDQPAVSRKDINDGELVNVRMKALWKPTDAFTVRATALIHRNDAGATDAGETQRGVYQQALGRLTTPSGEQDYDLYSMTLDYDFGPVSLVSNTSYLDFVLREREFGYFLPLLGPLETTPPFELIRGNADLGGAEYLTKTLTHETRLASATGGDLEWTAGVFYRDRQDDTGIHYLFGLPPDIPAEPLPFSPTRAQSKSYSIFGQVDYQLTQRLKLGAGVSYFEDDREETDRLANTSISGRFDSVNPRFVASYALSDSLRVYGSAAKGFRSGGFNAGGLAGGVPPYQPDSIWSYELGTKASLLEGRMSIEAALFFSEYTDVQVLSAQLLNDTITQFTTNSGDAEIKGIDWNIQYRSTRGQSVGVSGDFVNAEMVKVNALAASQDVGDSLDYVPDYHVNLWAAQEFNWFAGDHPGYVRVEYNRQGEMSYRNNTLGSWYHFKSDVIGLLNASVGWRSDRWYVDLFVRNGLNEHGWINANWGQGHSPRARPRTFGISFGHDF